MMTSVWGLAITNSFLLFLLGCPVASADDGGCEVCDPTAADPVFVQRDFRGLPSHGDAPATPSATVSVVESATPAQLLEGFRAVESAQANTVPRYLAEASLQLLLGNTEKSVEAKRQAARLSIKKNPKEAQLMLRDSVLTMAGHRSIEKATEMIVNDLNDTQFRTCVPAEVIAIASKVESLGDARRLLDAYNQCLDRALKAEHPLYYPTSAEYHDLLLLALVANQVDLGVTLVKKTVRSRSANCGDIDALLVVVEYLAIMGHSEGAKSTLAEAEQALHSVEKLTASSALDSVRDLQKRMGEIRIPVPEVAGQ